MKSLKVDKGVEVNHEAVDQIQVTRDNFMSALEKDIKPAYGHKEEDFEGYMRNGVHIWDEGVQQILDDVNVLTKQIERVGSKTSKLSILLHGKIGTGIENFDYFKLVCEPTLVFFYVTKFTHGLYTIHFK